MPHKPMKVINLGAIDYDADVCATTDGWLVASVPVVNRVTRLDLTLRWYSRSGSLLSFHDHVFTGTSDGGVNPRLAPADDVIWLSQRAIVNSRMTAALRRIEKREIIETVVLGPADGPTALSGDWVAWHDSQAGKVYGQRLTGSGTPTTATLRSNAFPSNVGTGLAGLDGSWPIMLDENRQSIAGMLDPVRRTGIVVGKGFWGGIEVRTGLKQPQGLLLGGDDTGDPRGAANEHGEYAAVCWGGSGGKLVLFTKSDLKVAA